MKKVSTSDLLLEIQKFRAVQIENIWKLNEVTKRQRTIIERMGILVSVKPNLIINNGGV